MKLQLNIKCDECPSEKEIVIVPSKKDNILSIVESIEQNSDGLFYCLQNYEDGFDLVCVLCGREQRVNY